MNVLNTIKAYLKLCAMLFGGIALYQLGKFIFYTFPQVSQLGTITGVCGVCVLLLSIIMIIEAVINLIKE